MTPNELIAEPNQIGRHRAVQERLGVELGQQFLGHLDLFEEFFQQMRGHMFGQFGVIQTADLDAFGDLVAVGAVHQFQPVAQNIVAADEFASYTDGPRCRGHVNRKVFLDFVNNIESIAAFAVHFVAKGQDRKVAQTADLEQFLGLAFHALGPVDHHHGRIHRRQRAIGVFGKIRVAGGVNKVEPVLLKVKRHRRGGHRDAAVLFHLHEVRPRAPRFAFGAHLSGHLNSATIKQELFR